MPDRGQLSVPYLSGKLELEGDYIYLYKWVDKVYLFTGTQYN